MKELTRYNKLLQSNQKIFNLKDLQVLWEDEKLPNIYKILYYYGKNKKIFKICSGLYSLMPIENIDIEDKQILYVIGQKLVSPSYITYHSGLSENGVNFQYYKDIFFAASVSKKIILRFGMGKEVVFSYHKISDKALYSSLGLFYKANDLGSYTIASKERSVIDSWYISPNIGIDNSHLEFYSKILLVKIAQVYDAPRIWKNLKIYFNIDKKKDKKKIPPIC